jgi:pilus assembly protein CpaB
MRNKRLIIAVTGAIFCGLIATLSVSRYLANAQAYTKSLGSVVVAKVTIPLGSKITAEQVTTAQIPNGSKPEGAFQSIDQVVGRVAITNIGVRDPVTESKLAVAGAPGGLPAVIPEGFRAMTVKVDDVVGISGFVMPGSFVDVVAVVVPSQQSSTQGPVSKIVLQNIKVLANGANLDQPKDGREATRVQAVTLQVTPEQAERLALASNEGHLQLVMRNYGDQEDSRTSGINKDRLLGGDTQIIQPAKSEPGVRPEKPVVHPARPTPRPVEERRSKSAPAESLVTTPRRPSVEVIEGSKRRSIEFP